MAPRNVDKMSSTITLVSIVLFATLCASRLSLVEANYYYHAGTNTNSYHHSKASGHYSSGMSPHHQIMHHKHHQHHGHNGRLQQAAVGVVNRGRLLPLTATAATTPPPTTLSPLDRLMSKLDSWDKQAAYDSNKRNHENLHHANARRHDPVSSGLLRSSDRRYAHVKTRIEDSYEDGDDDEDDEDEDEDDDFEENRDEDDEDEDEEETGFSRFTGGRHQHPHRSHSSHRNGHTSKEDPLFDSVVADFPDHPSGSPASGTMSDGASGGRGASYSDYKWRVLNKDNMDILRNQRRGGSVIYRAESPETQPYYINKLLEHNSELTKFGACRIPRPKVIKVSDEYPHPSKTYFPHCTILHRCSDDTGCCSSDSSTCAALKMEQVERFFYTKVFGGPQPKIVVEKLTFQNHTACTCLDTQQEMMPRDRPFSSSEHDTLGRSNFRGHYRPDMESAKTVSGSKGGSSCRCTSQFSPRHVADGSCACECFDKQRECLRLKRGKDFLTHEDRICILRGDCVSPSCEFGTYLRKQGRCPRKSEKFDAWQTYPLHDEEYQ